MEPIWVHLDLKGAPPTVDYLLALFPLLKRWGATGLLIEWEDMLPWQSPLDVVRHRDSFTADEVNILLKEAASNGLAVVPLVQTFGHMEFVLKHDAFASCREVPDGYMDICPLHSDSFNLVQAIVSQAIHTHPGCKYIHIGCDEVFGIGSCHKCKTKLAEDGLEALFMDYVVPLLRYIRSQGVQPLIWHDMIENFSVSTLSHLGTLAEVVVWSYLPNIDDFISRDVWAAAREAGLTLWGASAYKGATRPDALCPPLYHHVYNSQSWVARRREYRIKGMILTGWSRFNHCAALCEVLAAAVPSLARCLAVFREGEWSSRVAEGVLAELGLLSRESSPPSATMKIRSSHAQFPGCDLYLLVEDLNRCCTSLGTIVEGVRMYCPPMTRNANPPMWSRLLDSSESLLREFCDLKSRFEGVLPVYLRPAGVGEFLDGKVCVGERQCRALVSSLTRLKAQHSWGSRRLHTSDEFTLDAALSVVELPPVGLPLPGVSPTAVSMNGDDAVSGGGLTPCADDDDVTDLCEAPVYPLFHGVPAPLRKFDFSCTPMSPVVIPTPTTPVSPIRAPPKSHVTSPLSVPPPLDDVALSLGPAVDSLLSSSNAVDTLCLFSSAASSESTASTLPATVNVDSLLFLPSLPRPAISLFSGPL